MITYTQVKKFLYSGCSGRIVKYRSVWMQVLWTLSTLTPRQLTSKSPFRKTQGRVNLFGPLNQSLVAECRFACWSPPFDHHVSLLKVSINSQISPYIMIFTGCVRCMEHIGFICANMSWCRHLSLESMTCIHAQLNLIKPLTKAFLYTTLLRYSHRCPGHFIKIDILAVFLRRYTL